MAEYNYTESIPEGGFLRGVKYRNPHYFDGIPESDATAVSVDEGFPNIAEAYLSVGIVVNTPGEKPCAQELVSADESASLYDMDDDQLRAAYEGKTGKKPGKMKRETIIAALEEEE